MEGIMVLSGLTITIQKCDNGYLVNLVEPPKETKRKRKLTKEEENSLIDDLMEGVTDFHKKAHAESSVPGEEWKGAGGSSQDPAKARATFRAMFPGLVARALNLEPPEPKMERLVFPDKKSLVKFLNGRL